MLTIYNIGTGIAEVTDPAIGLKLQGMADPDQVVTDINKYESKLFARAFIVADRESGNRVVIVSADIWAATQIVKTEVINRLKKLITPTNLYTDDNVLISGTHTHSGPGGYTGWKLYDDNCGGFDKHNFKCIVSGIVTAIQNAHENLAPGKIYINTRKIGEIQHVGIITIHKGFCGEQRSLDAFKNNIEYKRDTRTERTDREMLLLKFVALDQAGELPIGEINWYPIHPTDRGQFNHRISGDNKGWASRLFEKKMNTDYLAKDTFVAAFANSNCGDVSGNVGNGVPNEETAKNGTDGAHMKKHGKIQYETAKWLFDNATEELSGRVNYRHTRIDMAKIIRVGGSTTRLAWPAALGMSFAAGSSEDSVSRIKIISTETVSVREGITNENMSDGEYHESNLTASLLKAKFGSWSLNDEIENGHGQKPIVLAPGLIDPPIVPNILPIQILKIGNLVITGVPGELTTMAGRRLKQTVLDELVGIGVDYLALATYANDYSQYITTPEEYDMQHYEGASTLFGPYTLEAYKQEFKKLAQALRDNKLVPAGPSVQSHSPKDDIRRITIRNNDLNTSHDIKLYKQGDSLMSFTLPGGNITLEAQKEIAFIVPSDVEMLKVSIDGSIRVGNVSVGDLITIRQSNYNKSEYFPPQHPQFNKPTIGREGAIINDDWLSPVPRIMHPEQPESLVLMPYLMQSNQSKSLEPMLHMMHSDQPKSLEPVLHMMQTNQPVSLQPILHMMNS